MPKICTFGAVQRGFALKKTMFNTFGVAKSMFRREKKDVHHIWGCPTRFRPKKNNVQHIWAWQNQCFAGKKKMFTTFGAVQR